MPEIASLTLHMSGYSVPTYITQALGLVCDIYVILSGYIPVRGSVGSFLHLCIMTPLNIILKLAVYL